MAKGRNKLLSFMLANHKHGLTMYIPPFEALLQQLNSDPARLEKSGKVEIPSRLLKLLLQLALLNSEVDEDGYLAKNADVNDAVKRGDIESGIMHYIGFGYFEGRKGALPPVDERWYLAKYPDVAQGITQKKVASATEHFYSIGAIEGRSPNAEQESNAREWKVAFGLKD